MEKFGQISILIYAVLMAGGGIMGYVTKKSLPSLMAGVGSGIFLVVAYGLAKSNPKTGFGLATLVAALLTLSFAQRFYKTGNFMPSGMLCIVSILFALYMGFVLMQSSRT